MVTSFVTGVLTLGLWLLFDLDEHVHEIFPATALSLMAFVILALAKPANGDVRVTRHFTKR
ncbi:MAG: hypothetical protein V3T15_11275 [Pseudomonadales bacterium]